MPAMNNEDTVIKRRRGSRHDKTGCLTCRYRRKKCLENTAPRCGSCIRLNLVCLRTPPPQTLVYRALEFAQPIALFSDVPTDEDAPSQRVFLRYYVDFLARKLTVCDQHNSFLSSFIPMAIESPIVLSAIIAFASANLSNFDTTYQFTTIKARSRAITALGKAIEKPLHNLRDHEIALASSLVLSASEALLGQRTGWSEHLMGAKAIIMSARLKTSGGEELIGPDAFKGNPEGEWLLRNFAYHDIISSVTSGLPALMDGAYLEGLGEVVDSYLGVHSQVLVLISKISALDLAISKASSSAELKLLPSCSNTEGDEPRNIDEIWAKYVPIEQALEEWHASTLDANLAALAYAYRSAALIYLYRSVRRHVTVAYHIEDMERSMSCLASMIAKEVAVVLASVEAMPPNGPSDAVFLFPLFMAGSEAIDPCVIDTIRTRLHLIDKSRGFRNVSRACEVLEEVWGSPSRADISCRQDWYDVLRKQGGGLLLT